MANRVVWIRRCASFAEERIADREYWAQMTPAERIDAVEQLRAEWASMTGHGDERLRRTLQVLQRSKR